jgi:pectinesterase
VNAAGPVGQGLALYVDADQAVFRNCRFIGNQDTIFNGGEYARQLFHNCFIEGTTDFIFGPATAVYQQCTIRAKSNSYITAANTTQGKKYGLVFLDCTITADSAVSKLYLGRPWRAYANTVFVRCTLPAPIAPQGWDNWSNPENEKTAYYAEYQSRGAGANAKARATWAKQLSDAEARAYMPERIFDDCPGQPAVNKQWFSQPAIPFAWPERTNK